MLSRDHKEAISRPLVKLKTPLPELKKCQNGRCGDDCDCATDKNQKENSAFFLPWLGYGDTQEGYQPPEKVLLGVALNRNLGLAGHVTASKG
jgi:hypothetical protein